MKWFPCSISERAITTRRQDMTDPTISIARKAYQAYVDKDRAAIKAVIGDDFQFTSPLDNRLDRKAYFDRCWKVLIALYENGTPFSYRVIDDAAGFAELESLWPLKKFPVLKDDEASVIESSIIVEHLMLRHPGTTRLIPDGIDAALKVRFMDRFFDNYIMTPMQKLVSDHMRAEGEHDPKGVAEAKASLDVAYGWLEKQVTQQG